MPLCIDPGDPPPPLPLVRKSLVTKEPSHLAGIIVESFAGAAAAVKARISWFGRHGRKRRSGTRPSISFKAASQPSADTTLASAPHALSGPDASGIQVMAQTDESENVDDARDHQIDNQFNGRFLSGFFCPEIPEHSEFVLDGRSSTNLWASAGGNLNPLLELAMKNPRDLLLQMQRQTPMTLPLRLLQDPQVGYI
jgi:hypothetical protein